MIRYVLAVVLSIGLLALSMPAIERGATMNTERTLDSSVASIDDAATELVATEDVSPDGHPDPQRVVLISLPSRSLTTTGVDHFEIVPHESGGFSVVRYVLEEGTTRDAVIDERIVWLDPDGSEPIELGGTGETTLILTLRTDANDEPVVVASRA